MSNDTDNLRVQLLLPIADSLADEKTAFVRAAMSAGFSGEDKVEQDTERLFERFGSLSEFFCFDHSYIHKNAEFDDSFLRFVCTFNICGRCVRSENTQSISIDDLCSISQRIFERTPYECMLTLYVGQNMELLDIVITETHGTDWVIPDTDAISRHIRTLKKAVGIFVIHNHPNGDLLPSNTDIETLRGFERYCENIGIVLVDSLIYGYGRLHSMFYEVEK